MNATLKETVTNRLEQSRQALNTALENGSKDTQQLREQAAEAERDLETLNNDEAARQEATETERETQMAEQAAREVETAEATLVAEMRESTRIQDLPEVTLPIDVAMGIQRAGCALQVEREAESAAKARLDKLSTRKSEIESARSAVINSRQTTGSNDDARDSQRLALCDADLEGLAPMIKKGLSSLQQARAAGQQAQQFFDQALGQWSATIEIERQRAFTELTKIIEADLVNVAPLAIQRAGMGISGYQPSVELRELVGGF